MANQADLEYVGKILDNVHGFVSYTEPERQIIDCLLFKRLQGIKQLSLVDWVFPGSEHTRYIHSIGVMHVADKMAIALKYETKDRQLIRLAALLHDIGHYPLSHVCESAYKDSLVALDMSELCRDINQKVRDEIDTWSDAPKLDMMKRSQGAHHEAVTARIIQEDELIHKVVTDTVGEEGLSVICDMITGNVERETTDPAMVQLLHSEIDADGIDYLLRDAVFSGTSFGSFELDMLIKNLQIETVDGKRVICIKEQGIPAADQYLINRFFSYSQVVFNKHTSVLDWMASRVVSWMRQINAYFPSEEKLLGKWIKNGVILDEYLGFDDNFFWKCLRDFTQNPLGEKAHRDIHYLACRLLRRQELNYIEKSEMRHETSSIISVREKIKESPLYQEIPEDDARITIVSRKSITKHVPMPELEEAIRSKGEDEVDVSTIKLRRLMEGAATITEEWVVQLLCDNPKSLMQFLYKVQLVILRQYEFAPCKNLLLSDQIVR